MTPEPKSQTVALTTEPTSSIILLDYGEKNTVHFNNNLIIQILHYIYVFIYTNTHK